MATSVLILPVLGGHFCTYAYGACVRCVRTVLGGWPLVLVLPVLGGQGHQQAGWQNGIILSSGRYVPTKKLQQERDLYLHLLMQDLLKNPYDIYIQTYISEVCE